MTLTGCPCRTVRDYAHGGHCCYRGNVPERIVCHPDPEGDRP